MTLENILLKKLAESPPVADRHDIAATEGAWTVQATFERRDELSGRLWEVAVQRSGSAADDVAQWAERATKRISGLLEPLKVVEVDGVQQEALLRSASPSVKSEDLFYYELHLRGTNRASFRRYHHANQPGKKRVQVPFALTHEALAKLAGDIAAEK